MINPEVARGTLLRARGAAGPRGRGLARRRARQDPARAAHRRARPHRDRPAHPLLRHGRRDAAVPDGRRRLLPLDARPRHDARAATGARRRAPWIDEWGDRDGDGFVEYERRSPGGLRNHGWKDSHDSIVHADGSLAEGPIALVEVQGYVYRGEAARSPTSTRRSETSPAPSGCGTRRGSCGRRSTRRSGIPTEGFFALALDGRKRQVAASPRTRRTACTAGSSTTTRRRWSRSG